MLGFIKLKLQTSNLKQFSSYPLNTLLKRILLVLETLTGSRNKARALNVALTTLCGLAEPNDFANTSVTPALSNTARIEPPAITPVPCAAGLINTFAAPSFAS